MAVRLFVTDYFKLLSDRFIVDGEKYGAQKFGTHSHRLADFDSCTDHIVVAVRLYYRHALGALISAYFAAYLHTSRQYFKQFIVYGVNFFAEHVQYFCGLF